MNVKRSGALLVAAAVAVLLATCGAPHSTPTPSPAPSPSIVPIDDPQARILAGSVVLRCRGECMQREAFHASVLRLYQARQWEALGRYIEEKGISDSHSYYFLGLAVWRQGEPIAAERYISKSLSKWYDDEKCRNCVAPADLLRSVSDMSFRIRTSKERQCEWDEKEWETERECCWASVPLMSWRPTSLEAIQKIGKRCMAKVRDR